VNTLRETVLVRGPRDAIGAPRRYQFGRDIPAPETPSIVGASGQPRAARGTLTVNVTMTAATIALSRALDLISVPPLIPNP
jgi:hypothetical protein